jgi:hypothetical protein
MLRNLHPPLPRALRSCHLDDLSYPGLEKAVLHFHIAEYQWLKRRGVGVRLSTTDERSSICLLGFLDDRWIISVPTIGPPAAWDTREDPPMLYKLSESVSRFFRDETPHAATVIDPHKGDIIIGLQR